MDGIHKALLGIKLGLLEVEIAPFLHVCRLSSQGILPLRTRRRRFFRWLGVHYSAWSCVSNGV